jgi:hypothetical protein
MSTETWADTDARYAPLQTALGTQADITLTVAVAGSLTPLQRAEWLDGWDSCRTGIGAGQPDYDSAWTRDIVWHAFPADAPQFWRDAEWIADESEAAADPDPDYGADVDGIFD